MFDLIAPDLTCSFKGHLRLVCSQLRLGPKVNPFLKTSLPFRSCRDADLDVDGFFFLLQVLRCRCLNK